MENMYFKVVFKIDNETLLQVFISIISFHSEIMRILVFDNDKNYKIHMLKSIIRLNNDKADV